MAAGDSSLLNFTIARRKKAGGTPSGVTAALALPSTVRSSVTISPSEENPDSLSSAAPSTQKRQQIASYCRHKLVFNCEQQPNYKKQH